MTTKQFHDAFIKLIDDFNESQRCSIIGIKLDTVDMATQNRRKYGITKVTLKTVPE